MCLSIKVTKPECVLSEGEHLGYEFVTVHNGMGYRCGYVRVPKGHPWHGKDCGDIDANVHGGLTFAQHDVPCAKGGEDDAYWVGFDCAHCMDAQDQNLPLEDGMRFFMSMSGEVRTQEYVDAQCRSLCEQAAKAATERT